MLGEGSQGVVALCRVDPESEKRRSSFKSEKSLEAEMIIKTQQ